MAVRRFNSISVLLLVFSISLLVLGAQAQPNGQPQDLPKSPLVVETADGTVHKFTVELAQTPEERNIGMMFRRSMEDDTGMLFIFPAAKRQGFWMRNTYIPLDIIFIKPSGRIANIVARAEPETTTSRRSEGPALAVLELRGGLAEELGIKPGDVVRHVVLGNWHHGQ